jgi:hypothetical protein
LIGRAELGSRPGFYFNENNGIPVTSDKVELDTRAAQAQIAANDSIALILKVAVGKILTAAAQRVRRVPPPSPGPVAKPVEECEEVSHFLQLAGAIR